LEPIKQALIKAKVTLEKGGSLGRPQPASPPSAAVSGSAWMPKRVQLDSTHLEQHRLVSFETKDPSHIAFNFLRTKVYRTLKDKGWTSIAVTSPTSGCGKTMVAINLAFSLARQVECKTVLVDLDLKRPTVGRSLGVTVDTSIGQYLEGGADLEQCFAQVTDNLIVGCNNQPTKHSSELMLHGKLREMLLKVRESIRPKVILFDLPPMLSGDEAIAVLPQVDCSILVIGSGLTTPKEFYECELQLGVTNFLGVVLNKCRTASNEHYYYGA
jgi:protein-tyrosine kinase